MPEIPQALKPEHVIGRRIESIWGEGRATGQDGWLEQENVWLILDNGFAIAIPASDCGAWLAARVPRAAVRIQGTRSRILARMLAWFGGKPDGHGARQDGAIVGARIANVYRRLWEGQPDGSESAVIELADGRALTMTLVAPRGTGAAGLAVRSRAEFEVLREQGLAPFWGESQRMETPVYPNSTVLFRQTMTAAGGGGGMVINYASADAVEAVVAFYQQRLGTAQRNPISGSAIWHFPESDGEFRGGQHVEVWPAAGAYPFREHQGALPLPPDARTVIHHSHLFYKATQNGGKIGPGFGPV